MTVRRTLATRLASAGIVLGSLALAGCSGDPATAEPTPRMPSTSASSEPTEEPTPTGPVDPTPPPKMEGDGVEAAEAFVEYYFAVATHAQNSGKTRALRRLALPSCSACAGGAQAVEEIYDAGGHVEGAELLPVNVTVSPSRGSNEAKLFDANATLRSAAHSVLSGPGAAAEERHAEAFDVHMVLVHQTGAWRMASWEVRS